MSFGLSPSATARPDSTEHLIRRAAIHLFAERGFAATGIRHIAEAVGINSSTLYHYMGTKEDLLFDIVQDGTRRLVTSAQRIAARNLDPTETVAALVMVHVWMHAWHAEETRVVDGELRSLDKVRRSEAIRLRDEYELFWFEPIKNGCDSGAFIVRDQHTARLAILQMCTGVANWFRLGGRMSLSELAVCHAQMSLGLLGQQRSYEELDTLRIDQAIQTLIESVWPDGRVPTGARMARGRSPR